jgi:hypothetical protein
MIDTVAAMVVGLVVIVGISAYFAGYRHGRTDGWQSGFENGVAYMERTRPDRLVPPPPRNPPEPSIFDQT